MNLASVTAHQGIGQNLQVLYPSDVSPSVADSTKVDTFVAYSPIISHLDTPPDAVNTFGHHQLLSFGTAWDHWMNFLPDYVRPPVGVSTGPWDTGPPPLEAPGPIISYDHSTYMMDKSNELAAHQIMRKSSGYSTAF
jgi:hypothetical protein